MAKVAVGVDIGGTNLRFGLVDAMGNILARKRMVTDAHQGVEKVMARIKRGIGDLIKKAEGSGHNVVGIGLGMPGIISHAEGIVRFSPNLAGWVDVPLRDAIAEGFGLPVFVENDANAYALGEAWYGAGRGAKSLICITLGTGVGGGIILDGKVWRGADGMAGEVGHITVDPKGPECGCGNRGCLERYSSATAVLEHTVIALAKGKESSLKPLFKKHDGSLTADAVREAAEAGDKLALGVYKDAGKYLGIALADLINLLNIERVVIGGGMAGAWGLFIGPLQAEIDRRAFSIPADRCRIVRGLIDDDAAVIGSAGLALKK